MTRKKISKQQKRDRAEFVRSAQIYGELTERPIAIIAHQMQCDENQAKKLLEVLAEKGYGLAPLEPTNHMLIAYLESYGDVPITIRSMIVGIGKARKRWKAMMAVGMRVSFTRKELDKAVETRKDG